MKLLLSFLLLVTAFYTAISVEPGEIFQSKREIPVIHSVDVLVIGGSTAAVSAAVSAAEQGAEVFLVAPKPYLGEDLCATLRLQIDENRALNTKIEKQIFNENLRVNPLHVKATLNKALIEAEIGRASCMGRV